MSADRLSHVDEKHTATVESLTTEAFSLISTAQRNGMTASDAIAVGIRPFLERLIAAKEQVDSLPKTADGVPIVPGMTVYCSVGPHFDEREVIGPYGKVALLTREPARHGACEGSAHRLAEKVYAKRPTSTVPLRSQLRSEQKPLTSPDSQFGGEPTIRRKELKVATAKKKPPIKYDPSPDLSLDEQVRHARGFAQGICRNDHNVARLLEQMARSVEGLQAPQDYLLELLKRCVPIIETEQETIEDTGPLRGDDRLRQVYADTSELLDEIKAALRRCGVA